MCEKLLARIVLGERGVFAGFSADAGIIYTFLAAGFFAPYANSIYRPTGSLLKTL